MSLRNEERLMIIAYLVYRWNGLSDELEKAFLNLDDAKRFVESEARRSFEYMKTEPTRYRVTSEFCETWREADGEYEYTYGEERHQTKTGEWVGRWGGYTIRPLEVLEKF
jgi:hypothetical protein